MSRQGRRVILACLALAMVLSAGRPRAALAQEVGGPPDGGRGSAGLARLELLTDLFKLTKDQRNTVKGLMDAASKAAEPVRIGLARTRPAIVAEIQAGKAQSNIDAATRAYAVEATSMAVLETRTLASILQAVGPEQRGNQTTVRSAFVLMRGAFLTKHWDEAPNPDKGY